MLRAEGRSFCVGYDVGGGFEVGGRWQDQALNWYDALKECLDLELMPWQLAKPVIASVQGHVLGGGCELSLFCDLTIAADDAKFGEPEIRFSNSGPGFVLPWIVGPKRAREMLYFGDMIDAAKALEIGMINRVVPRDRLVEETLKYAHRLAMVDAEALVMTKRAINRGLDAPRLPPRHGGRPRHHRAALRRQDRVRRRVHENRRARRPRRRAQMAGRAFRMNRVDRPASAPSRVSW